MCCASQTRCWVPFDTTPTGASWQRPRFSPEGVVLKKKKVIGLVPLIHSTLKSNRIGPLGQGPLHTQYPKKSENWSARSGFPPSTVPSGRARPPLHVIMVFPGMIDCWQWIHPGHKSPSVELSLGTRIVPHTIRPLSLHLILIYTAIKECNHFRIVVAFARVWW